MCNLFIRTLVCVCVCIFHPRFLIARQPCCSLSGWSSKTNLFHFYSWFVMFFYFSHTFLWFRLHFRLLRLSSGGLFISSEAFSFVFRLFFLSLPVCCLHLHFRASLFRTTLSLWFFPFLFCPVCLLTFQKFITSKLVRCTWPGYTHSFSFFVTSGKRWSRLSSEQQTKTSQTIMLPAIRFVQMSVLTFLIATGEHLNQAKDAFFTLSLAKFSVLRTHTHTQKTIKGMLI